MLTLPELQQHRPQEGFSRLPRRTLLYSCPHSMARCRGWRPWPGFRNRKGNHSWFSSVRSVEAANSSSEVVVSQADSLVGGGEIGRASCREIARLSARYLFCYA